MTLEVSPEVKQLVDLKLASGRYANSNEVLLRALRILDEHTSVLDDLCEGLKDIEAGRVRPLREVAEEIGGRRGFRNDE